MKKLFLTMLALSAGFLFSSCADYWGSSVEDDDDEDPSVHYTGQALSPQYRPDHTTYAPNGFYPRTVMIDSDSD